jgi:DNA-binding transcriptional LysR family regulator
MQLRQLLYFVAVAEELHFARAAERLHMAQPPLSRQISALERELGVTLFRRSKRRVELTDAGTLFLSEARRTIEQADHAAVVARRAGRGEVGRLEIAFSSSVPFTPLFPRLMKEFHNAYPELELTLGEMTTREQLDALADGRLDIGFVRPPILYPRPRSVALRTLLREPFLVAFYRGHALAHAPKLTLEALAQERFVMYPANYGTGFYDQITKLCRNAGFEPIVSQEAKQITAILSLVSAGVGITLIPASMKNVATNDIVYRTIDGASAEAEVALAYRREDRSAAIKAFVKLAGKLAAAQAA